MYDFNIAFKSGKLKDLGFKGACLVKEFRNWQDYTAERAMLESDYSLGVRIKAGNIKELINKAREFRNADYITINNPSEEVFTHALKNCLVDSVSGLELIKGYDKLHHKKTLLNLVTARMMSKARISMELDFSNLKNAVGLDRAVLWGRMLFNTWICVKKNIPIIITSGARKESELIHSEVLLAFAQLLKMNKKQAIESLTYAQGKIIERNQLRVNL